MTTTEKALEVIPRQSLVTEVTFDRVVVELKRADSGRTIRFDTAEPPAEEGGAGEEATSSFFRNTRPLRALAGSRIEVTQRPTGMIESFGATESLVRQLQEGLPPGDPLRAGIERILSFGSLRYMLTPQVIVPARPLGASEVLKFQDLRPLPETTMLAGMIYYRGTYRLASAAEGPARMEMEAEVSLDPYPGMPPWPPAIAANRERLRLARGTCRAHSLTDAASGVLEEDEHVTELDLVYLPPDGKGEVPLPTKVTQRTKRIR